MRYHTGIKIFFAALFIGMSSYAYYLHTDDSVKIADYTNVPDLSAAYAADEEIAAAKKKLADPALQPATVVTHKVDGKKQLALTFDGLPRKATLDRLLDVLDKHHAEATFFAEGGNAAQDKKLIEAINDKGQSLGNYTYIGMAKLNQMPQDEVIKELCMAQKVFKVTSNFEPTLFKAPKTNYDVPLLKLGAACGLKSAVKSDVYVNIDAVTSAAEAEKQLAQIKPGSIVSIVVGRPIEYIEKKQGKIDERPAIDKQPSLELGKRPVVKHEDIVEVTDRLLTACEKQGVQIVPLKDMRTVRLAPVPQQAAPLAKVAARVSLLLEDAFVPKVAYAADYEALRKQNNGRLAEEKKMLLTTEPSVAFCFAGFGKPESTKAVLDRMQKLGIHGTFFVGARDIRNNPQTMQRILADGHELAIAVYAKKAGTFATVCRDIEEAQTLLRTKYGVQTNIVKQPWGKIDDYTREAVQAMGCQLISQNVNMVQSRHKDYQSANDVLPELFGKFVYSVGRGWIINFRMDYYTNPLLCADVMQLLKEKKIDNIAYWSFEDDPKRTSTNDSAYSIKGVGSILANKHYTYTLPAKNIPERLRPEVNPVGDMLMRDYLRERYLGTNVVHIDSNTLGFTIEELRHIDSTGILHSNKPVVFFGFDDWGTDAPINQLLYVLRKHNVKGSFFILTHNVKNNPNLLRAIALEGHDIACHTHSHKPMMMVNKHERMYSVQTPEQQQEDYKTAYAELVRIVGDVQVDGHYSLTRMFRPPTLTISRSGFQALKDNGYEFIVSGSTSTHDYEADNLYEMIDNTRKGFYKDGKVLNGAIFVMHMSDTSKYTARALDILLTLNEKKKDDDPTKFVVGRLSDYLLPGYDQSNREKSLYMKKYRVKN